MRHPAEFWIKFLLSRQEHSYTEIAAMCEVIELGGVTPGYLKKLDLSLKADMPKPYRPYDKNHNASRLFLLRQEIYTAWRRDADMKAAVKLLGDSKVRALIESFLLSALKPKQVVNKVFAGSGVQINTETLEYYRHYFWNTAILSASEWGEYVETRRVAHKDWLKFAITAQTPQGVQLLLWKTGTGSLRHVEAGKMFTHLRNVAYLKALEMEHEPAGRDHSIAFRNYVQSAKMAQEEMTASAAAMMDILDTFQAFKMKTTEERVVAVQELDGTISEATDVLSTVRDDDDEED